MNDFCFALVCFGVGLVAGVTFHAWITYATVDAALERLKIKSRERDAALEALLQREQQRLTREGEIFATAFKREVARG